MFVQYYDGLRLGEEITIMDSLTAPGHGWRDANDSQLRDVIFSSRYFIPMDSPTIREESVSQLAL